MSEGVGALAFYVTDVVIVRKTVDGVSEQALSRFVSRARRVAGVSGRVQVLLTDDAEMRRLNRQFRRKDKATDVLSFPALPGIDGEAGDIAISVDIASRNAEGFGHPVAAELKILILHGMLHLAGYDHERDNGKMARTEHKLRTELKLPGSLIARSSEPVRRAGRKR